MNSNIDQKNNKVRREIQYPFPSILEKSTIDPVSWEIAARSEKIATW